MGSFTCPGPLGNRICQALNLEPHVFSLRHVGCVAGCDRELINVLQLRDIAPPASRPNANVQGKRFLVLLCVVLLWLCNSFNGFMWYTIFFRFHQCKRISPDGYITLVSQFLNPLWPGDTIWRHRSGSTLDQVMACWLMAPSRYLNQNWIVIKGVLWHSLSSNFTWSAQEHNP